MELRKIDRLLKNLQAAAAKLQKAPAGGGQALRAYIKALKTMNREMLGGVEELVRARRESAAEGARRYRSRANSLNPAAERSQRLRKSLRAPFTDNGRRCMATLNSSPS